MAVNGSVTPVVFSVGCVSGYDKFITELRFVGIGAGIKFGQWLNINSPLTNGLELKIKSDDTVFTFDTLNVTEDLMKHFAIGGVNFQLNTGAGLDNVLAVLQFAQPVPLRSCGSYTVDDYIQMTIQDNLTSSNSIEVVAFGFRREV